MTASTTRRIHLTLAVSLILAAASTSASADKPARAQLRMLSAFAAEPAPLPARARIAQERPAEQQAGSRERYVDGVPMPRLCARIADWANDQGISAYGGNLDMTGLMAAQFWVRSGWWVRTGAKRQQ